MTHQSPLTRPETVGIIDVGSNTIKLLIARPGQTVPAEKVDFHIEETRIGEGMTGTPPSIDADAIERGAAAIARLVKMAEASDCDAICIVATAAVREATNKQVFVNAVEKSCGHELRILSGDEEAALIGLALRCDPALTHLESFSLIDLGGGSLECIQFSERKIQRAESLPLGSVRLASLFVKDRSQPLTTGERREMSNYILDTWEKSKFQATSRPSDIAVLTGGAAKHLAQAFESSQVAAGLTRSTFSEVAEKLSSLPLAERIASYHISPNRADIFPTAIFTLELSLRYLGCERTYFSDYNLRFGIATSLLSHGTVLPPMDNAM